jgi:hypothetical protein
MPIRKVPGFEDLEYLLICYDANGRERLEDTPRKSALLSTDAVTAVCDDPVTDIFLMSHGWKGDVPAAITQYDAWIGAMASCATDRAQIRTRQPNFRPLLIGLHWPSLPWGDEELTGPGPSFDSGSVAIAKLLNDYTARIADSAAALEAIATIIEAALENIAPPTLPSEVRNAYIVLNREAGLDSANEGAAPGADREPFEPEQAYQNDRADVSFGATAEGILSVLRQLSFWKMKDRARRFGERSGHALLTSLQDAALHGPADVRIHLMGHSFGCIVMSSMLAGPDGRGELRPVDSLFLVQGALSLWSFCKSIPRVPNRPGYFRSVIADRKVSGAIVVTMSEHDTAVHKYYPLGAGVRRQVAYAPGELPKYGGVGVFGIRGPGIEIEDLDVGHCDHDYNFQSGTVYNLDAAAYINKMEGASGAHNDIAHPEIAPALWQAVMPRQRKVNSGKKWTRGTQSLPQARFISTALMQARARM